MFQRSENNVAPECRRTAKLKLDVRSQALHDWIQPVIASVFINQFTEPDGTGAAIESPPLRFSKRLNSGGIVTIHQHNIDNVKVLLFTLMPAFRREMLCLPGNQ